MAPTFRASSGATGVGTGGSASLTIPAAVQSGDIMVLAVVWKFGTGSGTINTPSGWTLLEGPTNLSGATAQGALFAKVAAGGDPGSTLNVSGTSATQQMNLALGAWTGATTSNTLRDTSGSDNGGTASTTVACASATIQSGDTRLVWGACRGSVNGAEPSFTAPTGGTIRAQSSATSGSAQNVCVFLGEDDDTTAGSVNATANSAVWSIGGQAVLMPAVTAGATPNGIPVAAAPGSHTTSIPTAAPAGIAVARSIGSPTTSIPAAAPSGIAIPSATGSPTVALNRSAAPSGLAAPAAAGSPTVAQLAAAPAGIAAAATLGSPTVATSLSTSPSGLAAAAAPGSPSVAQLAAAPAGIAAAAAAGSPRALVPVAQLVDAFDDGTLAAHWTNVYGGSTETGGRARIPSVAGSWAGIVTDYRYTLADSSIQLRLYPPPALDATVNAYAMLLVATAGGNDVMINVDVVSGGAGAFIGFAARIGGSDPGALFPAYDPVAHAWLRIREASGTLYLETSPDATSWTVQRSLASPSWIATDPVRVWIESYRSDGAAGYAEVDEINTAPTPAPAGLAVPAAAGTPEAALALSTATGGSAVSVALGGPSVAIPATSPAGLAVPAALGAAAAAVSLTTAPAGSGVSVALGGPSVAIPATSPAGLAAAAATGSPTVSPAGVSPAGLSPAAVPGEPAVALLGVGPAGIGIASSAGGPAAQLALAAAPAGIAVPVAPGAIGAATEAAGRITTYTRPTRRTTTTFDRRLVTSTTARTDEGAP